MAIQLGFSYGVEDHQLGDTSRACERVSNGSGQTQQGQAQRSRALQDRKNHIPEPRRRAVADSFLTSLEAAPAPAWAMGDILNGWKVEE